MHNMLATLVLPKVGIAALTHHDGEIWLRYLDGTEDATELKCEAEAAQELIAEAFKPKRFALKMRKSDAHYDA